MAAYCKQCSEEIFGEDFGELAGISTADDDRRGMAALALCEGCGPTKVNAAGECLYHKGRTAAQCFADTVRERIRKGDIITPKNESIR